MEVRRTLIDGNKKFTEGMVIEFDYKGSHYSCVIEKLHDNFMETQIGCFDYSGISNIISKKVIYKTGMKVTVSVKELYESNIVTENVYIDTENNDNGEIGYWDLYNNKYGLVCMDGETCEIISVNEDSIILKNEDGENDTEFVLTFKEADICCFSNVA